MSTKKHNKSISLDARVLEDGFLKKAFEDNSIAKSIKDFNNAKKTKVGANSYGIAPLAIAASLPSDGIFSLTQHAGCNGVQKNPGAIALTRIFFNATIEHVSRNSYARMARNRRTYSFNSCVHYCIQMEDNGPYNFHQTCR